MLMSLLLQTTSMTTHWKILYLHISHFFYYRQRCQSAWSQLRLSPMFGCICPGNSGKEKCDRVFKAVNGNPCIGKLLIMYISYLILNMKKTSAYNKHCYYVLLTAYLFWYIRLLVCWKVCCVSTSPHHNGTIDFLKSHLYLKMDLQKKFSSIVLTFSPLSPPIIL